MHIDIVDELLKYLYMRIHLTGSSAHLHNDLEYLRAIVEAIHSEGGSIVHNWVEMANHRSKDNGLYDHSEWSEIVTNNIDAISRADAVVIEGTNYGFFQGFQAALAVQRRCPVLFLSRDNFSNCAITGINSPLLTLKAYKTKEDIRKHINNYFKTNGIRNVELEIDERNYAYLRGEALLSGRSESEIINELIRERTEK